jgi:hypothetical protein
MISNPSFERSFEYGDAVKAFEAAMNDTAVGKIVIKA